MNTENNETLTNQSIPEDQVPELETTGINEATPESPMEDPGPSTLDLSNGDDLKGVVESLATKALDLPPTIALVFDTFEDLNAFKSKSKNEDSAVGIFGTSNVEDALNNYINSQTPVESEILPEPEPKPLTIREQLKAMEKAATGDIRLVIGRWLKELAEYGH